MLPVVYTLSTLSSACVSCETSSARSAGC